MKRELLLSTALALGTTAMASGQAAAPVKPQAAATAPGPAVEAMVINVVEVKGLVQVREGEGKPWKPAKVGMVLDQGAEFRTGPRSSVTCQIPPDQTLVLDRLGTVKIDEAIRSGKKIKTDVVMKYGRTKYDIETAGAEHESTIRSPGSTLAVRGTFVSLYDQPPFAPVADSFHGQAEFRNAHRQLLKFGGKTPTHVAADKNGVAETALAQSTIDPTSAQSRTRSENRYVQDQTSKSALFFFDSFAGIPVIRDGPPPPTDAQLLASVPSLPGALDVVMRWQGNANLNLEVGVVTGTNGLTIENNLATINNYPVPEYLYPGFGQNHSPGGGTIPYDNRGGPNGGMEIAYWGANYPKGLYYITALQASGGPALVTFDMFVNGKQASNLETLQVDSQGHLVIAPTGIPDFPMAPVNVKNNQITRPLSLTAKPNAADIANLGPDYFKARSVTAFVPASLENDLPDEGFFNPIQEPPVTFPPPTTSKGGKSRVKTKETSTAQKPANAPALKPAAPVASPPQIAHVSSGVSRESGGSHPPPKSR
jgi:hypothetical protein